MLRLIDVSAGILKPVLWSGWVILGNCNRGFVGNGEQASISQLSPLLKLVVDFSRAPGHWDVAEAGSFQKRHLPLAQVKGALVTKIEIWQNTSKPRP